MKTAVVFIFNNKLSLSESFYIMTAKVSFEGRNAICFQIIQSLQVREDITVCDYTKDFINGNTFFIIWKIFIIKINCFFQVDSMFRFSNYLLCLFL